LTSYHTGNSGIPSNNIYNIAIDVDNSKWVLSVSNLAKFDGTNFTTYTASNSGLPAMYLNAITIDPNGSKWIGAMDGSITKFDGTNWNSFQLSDSGEVLGEYTSMAVGANGSLWATLRGYGLIEFNENGIPGAIPENPDDSRVVVYPNPANSDVFIECKSPCKITSAELLDIQGNVLKYQCFDAGSGSIDIRDLPGGVYILGVQTNKGFFRKKLIKY